MRTVAQKRDLKPAKPVAPRRAAPVLQPAQRTFGNRAVLRSLASDEAAVRAEEGIPLRETPPIIHQALRSPGQPLDRATQELMESRFAHDFSGVRVHSGALADRSARAVNAHAYTVGSDMVFGKGRFAPDTDAGRGLIAHELTHVVQQTSAAAPVLQRQAAPDSDKSSQYVEDIYRGGGRRLGDPALSSAAEDVRHCREEGGALCEVLVTDADIDRMYGEWSLIDDVYGTAAANKAITDHALHEVAQKAAAAEKEKRTSQAPAAGGVAFGGLAVAPLPAPPPPAPAPGVWMPWASAGAANDNAVVRAAAAGPKPVPATAVGVAVIAVFGIYVTIELVQLGAFQEKLFAAGYKLLPSPRGVCMRGCHPSEPQRTAPQWPAPSQPLEPFNPRGGPLTPDQLKRLTDFLKQTEPSPDPNGEEERRRKRCPPIILLLPRAKAQDWDLYASLIGQLEHVPKRSRYTNQRYRWYVITMGRIPPAVMNRALFLGLDPFYVVFPFWGRTEVYDTTMQVDHDVEMQVTPIGRESQFDTYSHLRLMDEHSNTGAGSELEENIVKMREALVACTGNQAWMYRPIRFEAIGASPTNRPGIWTSEDLVAGRHLDAYERLGRPAPP